MMSEPSFSDQDFGDLTYCAGWRGEVYLPVFEYKAELRITVLPRRSAPTDRQRDAYKAILNALDLPLIQSFKEMARKLYLDRASRKKNVFSAVLPESPSKEDIWKTLREPALFIPTQNSDRLEIAIIWKATWDVEDGVLVYWRSDGTFSALDFEDGGI